MAANLSKCAKAPCKSCPYRRDVPSGVWAASEYEKLPSYDGEIMQQLVRGGAALFMCHQQDGCLCAGWVGTHGPNNLLALRMNGAKVDPSVWTYCCPVPLFASGAEARAHGLQSIRRPDADAKRVMARLIRKRKSVKPDEIGAVAASSPRVAG